MNANSIIIVLMEWEHRVLFIPALTRTPSSIGIHKNATQNLMLFAMAAVLFTLFDFDSQFVLLRSLHSIVNLNFAPSKFENKV